MREERKKRRSKGEEKVGDEADEAKAEVKEKER